MKTRSIIAIGIIFMLCSISPAGVLPAQAGGSAPAGLPSGLQEAMMQVLGGQMVYAPMDDQENWFGHSVAISGNVAVVGAPLVDVMGHENQGAAFVFTRVGTTWSQQAQLTATDGAAHDWFGYSVAISGNTALVGAMWDDIGSHYSQGSAYVFTRSGTTWSQQAKLAATDGNSFESFGASVALLGDTALIGVQHQMIGGNEYQGSAYVFTRSGTTWSQQTKLTAPDGGEEDYFGASVALSGDKALVGAPGQMVGGTPGAGSAYIFTRSGTTWSQQQKLTNTGGGEQDGFGSSVALSNDTALVGVPNANLGQGSAWAYFLNGSHWDLMAQFNPQGAPFNMFGNSLALWGDKALVGAYHQQVGANPGQGAAYLFTRSGTTWDGGTLVTAPNGAANDNFGTAVALSSDTMVVGAHTDSFGEGAGPGKVYFIQHSETTGTFTDVLPSYWAYNYIEQLYAAGITTGCSSTPMMYCPEQDVNRAQMAVFIERGLYGGSYQPPAGTGTVFTDVPLTYWAVNWIEKLAADGITTGCGGGNYCPEDPVRRDQMAVFLLRAKHGASYTPPPATGMFADVPVSHWAATWIEQLAREGITTGCGGGNYCPDGVVSRAQMAVFLVRAFSLP